jgi:hypothetical protein
MRLAYKAARNGYQLHRLVGTELVPLDMGTNLTHAFSLFACDHNAQAHKMHLSKWQ